MGRAFDTLSGGTENASIAMEKLQEATNGTMSRFDLFQQANNAMILGVSKNSDEMAEMFDVAQRLGQALGRDTASSVDSLIPGIGRQSRLMLDNIGIIVKAEEAYESYANGLNKTVDQLTDTEKKQAFLNATMESARAKVASLDEEIIDMQMRMQKVSAEWANARSNLGNLAVSVCLFTFSSIKYSYSNGGFSCLIHCISTISLFLSFKVYNTSSLELAHNQNVNICPFGLSIFISFAFI